MIQRLVVATCGIAALAVGLDAQQITLRIAIAPLDSGVDAQHFDAGVALGIGEAQRTFALFGGSVELHRLSPDDVAGDAQLARVARAHTITALVGGTHTLACTRLADASEAAGVLYLNARCGADALRWERCRALVFHVGPSDAMRRAAGREAEHAVAWDSTLGRYGAEQLNDRYQAATHTGMTEAAWAGWMAVKILAEAVLRNRTTDAALLAAALVASKTQFDGHKGTPLFFRGSDHQLAQPLYVPDGESGTREVPPAAGESARARLTRFGHRNIPKDGPCA